MSDRAGLLLDDTIAAISTPVGKSGIGIVRLSGRGALKIANKIFIGSNGLKPSQFHSHTLNYGRIIDSAKLKKSLPRPSQYIDEVLLGVMHGPKTYTREDIVEINCHSGIVVLKKLLELVLRLGARLARPGEFTQRAYLNGRIDLAQAEAVLDIINSQTDQALTAALGQLSGRLSAKIKSLRKKLLDILMQLEASIDFIDQGIRTPSVRQLLPKITAVLNSIQALLETVDQGMMLREGTSCVICGRPNVGKSSLLNALLKRERAIVTPIPGTTRDTLEEGLDLFGIPLRLMDTAGITQPQDLAEQEAVKRSRQYIKEADLALFVLDASQKLKPEDITLAGELKQQPVFIVLNKQDLPTKIDIKKIEAVLPGKKTLGISALRGRGLDALAKQIADYIWQGKARASGEILVTNTRHKQALEQAKVLLQKTIQAVQEGQGQEIISFHIQQAKERLEEIIGKITHQDVLKRIFSQFCIGK